MGMGVDQSRGQQVVVQADDLIAVPFLVCQGAGQQVGDAAVAYHQGVVFQHGVVCRHGGNPAGVDNQVGLMVAHA